MSWSDLLLRLGLSLVLASPIGWEREMGQKPAGLRTLLLVSLGCCLFVLIGLEIGGGERRGDPGRVAAQVVTGIGFLGGGAILRAGGAVRGLTTAASIWVVAAIGMACGAGFLRAALVGTLLAFFVLRGLDRWERRIMSGKATTTLRIRIRSEEGVRRIRETLSGAGFEPEALSVEKGDQERVLVLRGRFSDHALTFAFRHLSEDPEFLGIERRSHV